MVYCIQKKEKERIAVVSVIAAAAVICAGMVWIIRRDREKRKNMPAGAAARRTVDRCPNCGSPVIRLEHGWECGYCGNSGSY